MPSCGARHDRNNTKCEMRCGISDTDDLKLFSRIRAARVCMAIEMLRSPRSGYKISANLEHVHGVLYLTVLLRAPIFRDLNVDTVRLG